MIEQPQGFVVAQECGKAAWQHGYRRSLGEDAGWAGFGSTTAKGIIHLAAAGPSGPWYLAIDHTGVVEELSLQSAELPGPGQSRYAFETLTELYSVLPKVYDLALTLPEGPLEDFRSAVRDLPQTTEAERLVVQRIGQDIFRDRLMDLLARTLSPDRHHRPRLAPCLSHHPVEGLPQRRRAPQRPQRTPPLSPLGRRLRLRPSNFRRQRPAPFFGTPERNSTIRTTLARTNPPDRPAPPTTRNPSCGTV